MKDTGAIFTDSKHWWSVDADDAWKNVFEVVKMLKDQQAYRCQANLRHAKLYGNMEITGFSPSAYARPPTLAPVSATAPLNVCKAAVDTVAAKNAKNKPRPSFATSNAKWAVRQRAKLLNKFSQGQLYELKVDKLRIHMIFDALIFGTGVTKVYEYRGRIRGERVLPDELLIDDAEAIYGQPRQMHQVKSIARDVLVAMFADDANKVQAIRLAQKPSDDASDVQTLGDMVEVVESWHLPSDEVTEDMKEKDHDGRHTITISNYTLMSEEWRGDWFPFAFMHFSRPMLGFWSAGLVEDLVGIQLALNKLHKRIQDTMKRYGPRVLIRRNSKIPKEHITNSGLDVIEVDNPSDVVHQTAGGVPVEWFQERDRLYQLAFERAGVSQLSATMMKPAGLDAKVALREYNDIESERFVIFGQNGEDWTLDLAKLCIRMARDLTKRDPDDGDKKAEYEVRVPDRKFVESVKWSQIDLEEDQYVMQCFPVSALPSSPSARQQTISEWVAAGWVSPEEGRRLADFPDLEQSTSLAVAILDDVDATIDQALEKGEDVTVEPLQKHDLLMDRSLAAYLRAKREGYPEAHLECLRNVIGQCEKFLSAKEAAAAPPPMPMTPAAPMPPEMAGAVPPPQGLPQ